MHLYSYFDDFDAYNWALNAYTSCGIWFPTLLRHIYSTNTWSVRTNWTLVSTADKVHIFNEDRSVSTKITRLTGLWFLLWLWLRRRHLTNTSPYQHKKIDRTLFFTADKSTNCSYPGQPQITWFTQIFLSWRHLLTLVLRPNTRIYIRGELAVYTVDLSSVPANGRIPHLFYRQKKTPERKAHTWVVLNVILAQIYLRGRPGKLVLEIMTEILSQYEIWSIHHATKALFLMGDLHAHVQRKEK